MKRSNCFSALPAILLTIGLFVPAFAKDAPAVAKPTASPDFEKLKSCIDILVAPTIKAGLFPGMVVGILEEGQVQVFGYGKTSLSDDRVPDGNTEYEIGSVTKLFTELLLLDMVRKSQMGLDDPASKYFPKNSMAPNWDGQNFTLLQLAKHTSGLPRNPDNENMMEDNVWGDYTLPELYDYLSRCRLEAAPGGKFLYSNTGYGLLSDLICTKRGMGYEDYLKKTAPGSGWNEGHGCPVDRGPA
jgi:CubicO group peptidase (beta-lactamase class C family)